MASIEKEYMERIRRLMRERRISLSMKQSDAAKRSGVNIRTVQQFEQYGEITLERLLKLFIAYKMESRFIQMMEDRNWWTIEENERANKKSRIK